MEEEEEEEEEKEHPPRRVSKRRRRRQLQSDCNVNHALVMAEDDDDEDLTMKELISHLTSKKNKMIVFSGAGISVSSGLSTFNENEEDEDEDEGMDGLYNKVTKQYSISSSNGKDLFRYKFLKERPKDCSNFLYNYLYLPAVTATIQQPTVTYRVLSNLMMTKEQKQPNRPTTTTTANTTLIRHYTFNIDGLTTMTNPSKLSSWHPKTNPNGTVVELHGTVHDLVCRNCRVVVPTSSTTIVQEQEIPQPSSRQKPSSTKKKKRSKNAKQASDAPSSLSPLDLKVPSCSHCSRCDDNDDDNHNILLRFRVLLYDDEEGNLVHDFEPRDLDVLLDHDIQASSIIVWVGISFEQSSSCYHFQIVLNKLLRLLNSSSSVDTITPADTTECGQSMIHNLPLVYIINPDVENVWFNLQTSVSGLQEYPHIYKIKSTSDDFFRRIQSLG